jgi:hypothetical protein
MRLQPFRFGQLRRWRPPARQRGRRASQERGALHEVEHAEARRRSAPSARSAARGWSRRHSRRWPPACDGRGRWRRHSRMRGHRASGIRDGEFDVLGRDQIGDLDGLIQIVDDDDRAVRSSPRAATSGARRRPAGRSTARSTALAPVRARRSSGSTARPCRARPGPADRPRPSRPRRSRRRSPAPRRARRSCRCRPCRRPAAWPPPHRHCRGRRSWRPGAMVSVPKASAATACAPPTR